MSKAEGLRQLLRRIHPAAPTVAALGSDVDRHGAGRRDALRTRFAVLIEALGGTADLAATTAELLGTVSELMSPVDGSRAWLALAVLEGRLPDEDLVQATVRAARLDGVPAALRHAIWSGPLPRLLDAGPWRPVQVVTGRVLVDVQHTAQTSFATGIQRVTRESTRRWAGWHRPLFVGWTADHRAIRALTAAEAHRAFWGGPPVPVPVDDPVVVPWKCTYVLPELAAEVERTAALQALARYSGNTLNAIGYDLVPMTTGETAHEGLVPGFARNLAAMRHARVIAPISNGAAGEYRGWKAMLAGAGLVGPRIEPVVLPAEIPAPDPGGIERARQRLVLGELPLVLVVGSHEPRKNHLAVLHAADLLWREGRQFCLTFIGGNSWNSGAFLSALERLQLAGRPVETISAAEDDLLFGAYRVARFTIFPSINEGYGLPVAESLAAGTPVITSGFGSMAEIAAAGGAVLVDPRDDHSIAAAMRALLSDDRLLADLAQQANARPRRTWDDYADQAWRTLTEPVPHSHSA